MLEAMIDIGNILLKDNDIIRMNVKKIALETKQNKKRYAVIMNFNLQDEKITFDIEELDDETVVKYLHMGHEGGKSQLQWYQTSERCNTLITHSLLQLYKKIDDADLKRMIEKVINLFFIDQGEELNSRYRYIIDVDHFFNFAWRLNDVKKDKIEDNPKNPYTKLFDYVAKEITKYCADQFEIKSNQIGLFTTSINNQIIALTQAYRQIFEQSMNKEEKKKNKKREIVCSVCGSTDNCTSKVDISIKFYTTNLNIFAHKMDRKNYKKNLVLCNSCHDKFKTASRFLENELKTKIAGYDVYVIPHVIYGENLNSATIKRMAAIINPLTGSGKSLTSVADYREEVDRRLQALNEENYIFSLNILFYRKIQAATKIQKMIQDINPSVFSRIFGSFFDTLDVFQKYYPIAIIENLQKRANLKFIYYMHPVKLKDGSPTQYQKVLKTYENILCSQSIRNEVIFSNFADVLNTIWREKEGYNISFDKNRISTQKAFDFKLLDCMYYIRFLEEYGSLEGGEGMDTKELNLNEAITSYIREMNYNEQQTSLFLLGLMIGAIGREQSNRQREKEQDGTYKPILNKINFNGMDKYRIMKLSNQIPNKLRHEKIQKYYEAVFGTHKYLLDKNIHNWKLSKDENLFYLLSGYGYQTMKKKTDKEVEKHDKKQ